MSILINMQSSLCLLCPYCTLQSKEEQLLAQLSLVCSEACSDWMEEPSCVMKVLVQAHRGMQSHYTTEIPENGISPSLGLFFVLDVCVFLSRTSQLSF